MSNTVVFRIPPLELDVFGNKVQIRAERLNAARQYKLTDKEAKALRAALEMLASIGRHTGKDKGSPPSPGDVT